MPCDRVTLPDGTAAIVCSRGPRRARCACGKPATRLCDWKVPGRRSGTCDAPICASCATSPAPDKDICPAHAPALRAWQETRPQAASGRATKERTA